MFRFFTRKPAVVNDQRRADLQASLTSWMYAAVADREIRAADEGARSVA